MSGNYDPKERFDEKAARYDDEITTVIPGYDTLHELTMHILSAHLPDPSHVMVAGIGTANEAINLTKNFPTLKVTGFDVSDEMLKTASTKIESLGVGDRITLVKGTAEDIDHKSFDAATSMLVMHFVARNDKFKYLRSIADRLKPGGAFVSAEVVGYKDESDFESHLGVWESFQRANRERTQDIPETLEHIRNDLALLTRDETTDLMKQAGFKDINFYFRSLMIQAYSAVKA